MCNKYQFRFRCDDKEISTIFNIPEISKAFESAFMENYWLILKRMREYKTFLSLKNVLNEQGFLLFNLDDLEDENKIISVFKQELKTKIFYLAIMDVFFFKLNVKCNILKKLNADFIKEFILDEHLLTSINQFVDVVDASLGIPYQVLEDLVSEFLQK